MLAETDERLIIVSEHESSCIIDSPLLGRELCELVDVVLNPRVCGISVKLSLQHLICCQSVSLRGMSILKLLSAVECVGGFQCARLHCMENVLHIHHLHLMKVNMQIRSLESAHSFNLLGEHRKIELGRIESCEIASAEPLHDFFSYLMEGRTV